MPLTYHQSVVHLDNIEYYGSIDNVDTVQYNMGKEEEEEVPENMCFSEIIMLEMLTEQGMW